MPSSLNIPSLPRWIVVDDNVSGGSGHYSELSELLTQAAHARGWRPVMLTHRDHRPSAGGFSVATVQSPFSVRRMTRWSLGVDGGSKVERTLQGRPLASDGGVIASMAQSLRDARDLPSKRPRQMIKRWSDSLLNSLRQIQPSKSDRLLLATGDDFVLLALAETLRKIETHFAVDVLFHFALTDSGQPSVAQDRTLHRIGEQTRRVIDEIGVERVRFFATTQQLAEQWNQADLPILVKAIPYPTRPREVVQPGDEKVGATLHAPLNLVLAGAPRAEKGSRNIQEFLGAISAQISSGQFKISLQGQKSLAKASQPGIEVLPNRLETGEYHSWLDTADIGLFLYEPNRYEARCSGVMLEMLVRGIPVVVPDGCWLSDTLRDLGRGGAIYGDPAEIPGLLKRCRRDYASLRRDAMQIATVVAKRHEAAKTLDELGLPDVITHGASRVAA